ncbi:hypothetical protein PSPO01_07161 [Paraphaeosphaeria sporulosa]
MQESYDEDTRGSRLPVAKHASCRSAADSSTDLENGELSLDGRQPRTTARPKEGNITPVASAWYLRVASMAGKPIRLVTFSCWALGTKCSEQGVLMPHCRWTGADERFQCRIRRALVPLSFPAAHARVSAAARRDRSPLVDLGQSQRFFGRAAERLSPPIRSEALNWRGRERPVPDAGTLDRATAWPRAGRTASAGSSQPPLSAAVEGKYRTDVISIADCYYADARGATGCTWHNAMALMSKAWGRGSRALICVRRKGAYARVEWLSKTGA